MADDTQGNTGSGLTWLNQGGPTCAVIAAKQPDIVVTVVDLNKGRIAAWNSDKLPVSEPGLSTVVSIARDGKPDTLGASTIDPRATGSVSNGLDDHHPPVSPRRPNLFFSTEIDRAIQEADLTFLSVDTPALKNGRSLGAAPNLDNLLAAAQRIASVATHDFIVVEKSTVSCGTAKQISDILAASVRPGVRYEVLSNPEFLAEGTAIQDLLKPDRVIIGSFPTERGLQAAEALAGVYSAWVPQHKIVTLNTWSSELCKLAANAMLAQRISSINSLSAICESLGADIAEVSHACGLDKRIGPHMLNTSVGFGGSCFHKDVLHLVYLAESLQLQEVAAYWKSVIEINECQKTRFFHRIATKLYDVLPEKIVAVFGFAFKAGTADTRESAAIAVVQKLASANFNVRIYDPLVPEAQIWRDLEQGGPELALLKQNVTVCETAYEACENAHAVAILTEWQEFSSKSSSKASTRPMGSTAKLHPEASSMNGLNGHSGSSHVNGHSVVHQYTNGQSSTTHFNSLFDPIQVNGHSTASHANGHATGTCHSTAATHHDPASLQWDMVAKLMQEPRYIFDGRNIVGDELEAIGFQVESIGRASKHHDRPTAAA